MFVLLRKKTCLLSFSGTCADAVLIWRLPQQRKPWFKALSAVANTHKLGFKELPV